jgi:hypothetical protein
MSTEHSQLPDVRSRIEAELPDELALSRIAYEGPRLIVYTETPRAFAERDDVEYCLQRAGWGTDRDVGPCRNHPVTGEQWGESNPNFKHGRTSEYFRSKLSGRQQEVYNDVVEELADDGDPDDLLAAVVGRLLLLGEHARDSSLLREARQWAADFGVLETAAEKHELEHSGEVDTGDALDEATQAAVREVLADRRGDS